MKRIAAFVLLVTLGVVCFVPAFAENTAATHENMRRAHKAAKQQQKVSKKMAKKQQKAMKKYEKAQRKGSKKAHHRAV
jgi:hypothetical protein